MGGAAGCSRGIGGGPWGVGGDGAATAAALCSKSADAALCGSSGAGIMGLTGGAKSVEATVASRAGRAPTGSHVEGFVEGFACGGPSCSTGSVGGGDAVRATACGAATACSAWRNSASAARYSASAA